MSVPGPVALDLPADAVAPGVVRVALLQFASSCADVHLLASEIDEVSVAVQEACTNVVRHAYACGPVGALRVEIHRRLASLEIRVIDSGPPFEIDDAELPDPTELREGGYGTHIMRSWMHEVDLRRERGRNVLRLVRYYAPEGVTTEAGDHA